MYFPSYSVEIEEIAAYLATVSPSGKLKGGIAGGDPVKPAVERLALLVDESDEGAAVKATARHFSGKVEMLGAGRNMRKYFGDKKGLHNQDFGQSGVALPKFPGAPPDIEVSDDAVGVGVSSVEHQAGGEIEAVLGELSDGDDTHEDDLDDLDDDDSIDPGDAAAVVEAGRHEAIRNKRKLDLPEALVTMGSTLAAALAAPEHTSELAGVSTQLAKIQKTQELIVSAIEE
ncbi:hypothetical protein PF006_g7449 [Phytophthora fragariae]|uniref:Uncharacterized protein n=1 Tax=Phytophthora fragariae TaxID=53985 RepID=A0A6A3LWX6_9STRA|nr:hypothetical protein PF011_g4366 [Phytophthora fragariae]KAE9147919.1 hypothetical protein PF006_g7449 [Phytophthora fragariae]